MSTWISRGEEREGKGKKKNWEIIAKNILNL